ncbi:AMP-dependent synthetase/ligase [Streptomyces mayonensis]|uniref:AMP-dependent synthetase/ligase n=1 Tax=Streptomyces mayonensis TaxID=2750816 RepID=UPI001C1E8CDA|nr:long-chain fatty acid--CoA ligase [Streptomyces sp. A108]MBU6530431.1 long-chain fatty acid--CoA ligase [Streptomyces sp. A108]
MHSQDALRTARSLPELFQQTVRRHRDRVALRRSDGGPVLTWGRYSERVERIAAGLARLGVRQGDAVALMLTNRPEFHLVDTAVLHLGATPFSVYNTSAAGQVGRLFANAGNRIVVTEKQYVPVIRAAGGALDHMVCVDDCVEGTLSLDDVEADGTGSFDFEAAWRAVGPGDLATLIYTSGTTGAPKGVELEHRALLASLRAGLALEHIAAGSRAGRLVSYLPDAHVANRYFGHYLAMATGASVTTVADPKTMAHVLPALRPTVFLGVPAFWYRLQGAVNGTLSDGSGLRSRLAAWAVSTGRAVTERHRDGRPVPAALAFRHAVAERVVLRRLRARIGLDRAVAAITGSAPINPDTVRLFLALGVQLCEGWAMSESAAGGSVNRPGEVRPGTVGRPMHDVEVRVAEDGELLLRGPTLMRGYRGDQAQTAEALDGEGWLRTGDVGNVDADGYVTILDRKKDLIINAYGKNMSPAGIENAVLAACPLLSSVVAIGDRRPYVTALATLDPAAARTFVQSRGLPGDGDIARLAGSPEIRAEVDACVERANAALSRVEQIKYLRILPTVWAPSSEELTPTSKLRRRRITEKYAGDIEELYRNASLPDG